ncbi:OmpA family protein [Ohtaekwangia koreensis]|uniref:OmpA family protein n=1 Tax=Ohtaekwangia koreensis TaxID=688867 RepID=A0A1T5JPU2_9BACT|nr:OmpA family protein [Ohtaekwangia koreensis]SKC53375.1 OmpA family protein [Ohtaekwangia koreensis]
MVRLYIILFLLLPIAIQAQEQPSDEIRKSIYFGGGSYDIDEFQALELYHWLDSFPNLLEKYQIHLISHTDPIGGKQFNEWLSKMRSESVQHLLLEKEIPEHKITIKDWGLENPVYSNQTFSGMQMNRRVDVILYPIVF